VGGVMGQKTLKAKIERIIHNLPEETSIEEAMDVLTLR